MITSLVNGLLAAIPQIIQAGIDLLTSLISALPEIITTIVSAIPEIINGIITALLENIPQIVQAGIDLLVALIQALPQIITTIVQAIPQIISGIVNALVQNIPQTFKRAFSCSFPSFRICRRSLLKLSKRFRRSFPVSYRRSRVWAANGECGRKPSSRIVGRHFKRGFVVMGQSNRLGFFL